MDPAPRPEVGYVALLRDNASFRRLFLSRLVSLFGDWFNLLAALALLRAIGAESAGAFGWVLILKMLPSALLAPVAGVVADRVSRRGLMIGADLVRAVIVAGMLLALWYPEPALIYALLGLQAAVSVFFEPARSALLPDIVSPEELTAANALGAATWSAMLALGSAAGGLFTATLGWQAALVVDVGSYLLSAVLLLGLVEPDWERSKARGLLSGFRDLAEGIRYMAGRGAVWTLALVKSGWMLGAGAATLLLTLLGEQVFSGAVGEGILAVTVLYMARGLGTGSGPILARWISSSDPPKMERLIGAGYITGGVFYLGVAVSPSLWVAAAMVTLAHLGGATCWVFSTIRLQQLVPSRLRGRVFAAEQAPLTLASAGVVAIYSGLSDRAGLPPRTLLAAMALSMSVPALAWTLRGRWLGWAR
ncbi:MAG: hypothetical protein ACI8S6_000183 [Myxococcota bacterium]|jgi:hypothetical protein